MFKHWLWLAFFVGLGLLFYYVLPVTALCLIAFLIANIILLFIATSFFMKFFDRD